ncbi:class I SAM-dependent methyltransferase [Mailhella massiliensis]|uniref:Class I SAM-dependent methyltransferase n=1 Tax=Mailhella massiliensis TaxID=1903261 RepID=A0A921AXV8_9BACT|nr:class I SAM-dependent methyltransferase [Mailhella massiliensis]HJD97867.1 class I SAM-dependent methyltransferase [Mailhella massiliensis]
MAEFRRQFLSVARQKVLHQLISGWHRRGATLLQVGLNAGFSPEFFWEAGFDVTAVDRSPACLAAAREQTGPRVEYVCGAPDFLPFENGSFDYAVLVHHGLRAGEAGRAVLEEALRVAARGIIIMEWNSFSLAGAPKSVQSRWAGPGLGEGEAARAVSVRELYGMVRRACPGLSVSLVSALPLWEGTWPDGAQGMRAALRRAAAPLNLTPLPLPVGALLGMRVDWAPVPLTPIGMLKSAAASLCAPPQRAREGAMGRVCPCTAEGRAKRRGEKMR